MSQPSHGVGYEIGRAVAKSLPVLCLWRSKEAFPRPSAMLSGCRGIEFKVYSTEAQAKEFIDAFITVFKSKSAK